MIAILALVGILVLLFFAVRGHSNPTGVTPIRPRFRKGLSTEPTREELIRHGEARWADKYLPLGNHGEITACIGRNTYVWRDPNNRAHIVCHKCACDLAAQAYSDKKGPLETTVGTVHGLSVLDMAKMKLKSMWFYTNHYYVVTHRGGIRAVNEELPNFFECEHPNHN